MLPDPLPLFSPTALTEAFQRNPTRVRKLIGYFIEDLPGQIDQLHHAMLANNMAETGAVAHSIKSAARQVGAFQLGETAAQLEHAARYAVDEKSVQTCWQKLQSETGPTCNAMQGYLEQTTANATTTTPTSPANGVHNA